MGLRFILSYLFLEARLLVSWVCLLLVARVVFHFLLILLVIYFFYKNFPEAGEKNGAIL